MLLLDVFFDVFDRGEYFVERVQLLAIVVFEHGLHLDFLVGRVDAVDAYCLNIHLLVEQSVSESLAFLQHVVISHLLHSFIFLFRLVEGPLRRFVGAEVFAHLVFVFIIVQVDVAVDARHDLYHHFRLVFFNLVYLRQVVFVQPPSDANPLIRFDVNHFGFIDPHNTDHVIEWN